MAERQNRFLNLDNGIDLRNITKDINDANKGKGHNVTHSPDTEKDFRDIDIDLIDECNLNEIIFGYNNLSRVSDSLKEDDSSVVICVWIKNDGRYECWDGNTRLKAMRELKVEKITCQLTGPAPATDLEKAKFLIRANTYRTFDPYHIAREIELIENLLRAEGTSGQTLIDTIAVITGYKETAQKYYKQILKLNDIYYTLFDSEQVPFRAMLKICKKVPDDKAREFVSLYLKLRENKEESKDLVEHVFATVMNNSTENVAAVSSVQISKIYKDIFSVKKTEDGTYLIPENKKEALLNQIKEMEDELAKIKIACENE